MTTRSNGARPGPRDRAWSLFVNLLVVAGLGLLTTAGFQIFGNRANISDRQTQLEQQWDAGSGALIGEAAAAAFVKPPEPMPGDAIAKVSVPALGQHWFVVEGVDPADIAAAPGHFPDSADPGQKGNFALAAHRQIGLFWDLDKIRAGDEIVVETRQKTFTYVVTRNLITSPQIHAEVSAVPPGFRNGDRVLTLTTCNPKWDNYQRLVVHALLKK